MASQRLEDIPFSGIRKIFEECSRLESRGTDVVHLEIGRPDFDTPDPIKDAARRALDEGQVHYTSNYGIPELRRQLAAKLKSENDIEYDADGEIIVTAGATEAVFVTVMALVDEGEEVLIPNPAWTYAPSIHAAGGTPVRYELNSQDGFQPDLSSLERAVSEDASMIVVNSPHNPTGGVLDREHVSALRDFAVDNDLLVLSDEIYEKICYTDAHRSLAALDGLRRRTITVNGFSKAYSMTGWRLGYLAAPAELIDSIVRLRQYTTTCAPSISQHAGARAVGSTLHEPMVEQFARRRELVLDRIDAVPGMTTPEPAGAFYAFPTVPAVADTGEDFAWSLLREAGVALVPGTVFGPGNEDRIRIAYSNSEQRLREAFDRIEAWVASR